MPAARVSGRKHPSIDYTLNLLGIRVWENSCVLIARRGWNWRPIGVPRSLPIQIPERSDELRDADELSMTAYQLQHESPEMGIADLLSGRKPFATALEACTSCAIA